MCVKDLGLMLTISILINSNAIDIVIILAVSTTINVGWVDSDNMVIYLNIDCTDKQQFNNEINGEYICMCSTL